MAGEVAAADVLNRDLDHQEYGLFSHFLEDNCGIVLGANKQYLVRSRLAPLVREYQFESLSELVHKVVSGREPKLREAVINAMTTNETLWFRDTYPFELLKTEIFPELASKGGMKIWSAACSSGQEPYSIAISALEYQQSSARALPQNVQIVATDLSTEMLERASSAEYDSLSIGRGLSEQRKRTFFEPVPGQLGHLRVCAQARRMVSFKPINLLQSFTGIGRFDVVFCRNVLIYFSPEVKTRILQQIAACLQKDGILFLGASESITGLSNDFVMQRSGQGLFYRKK